MPASNPVGVGEGSREADASAVVEAHGSLDAGAWDGGSYAVYGVRDGDPVVFCHPVPGSRVIGRLLAAAAADLGVTLVVPERPGYGEASPHRTVGPFTAGLGLGDVGSQVGSSTAVLDAMDAREFGVVGFSSGCPFALALAAEHPERVEGVALVSSSSPPDGPGTQLPVRVFGDDLFGSGDRDDPAASRPWYVLGWVAEWIRERDVSGFRTPGSASVLGARIARSLPRLSDEEVVSLYGDPDLVSAHATEPAPVLRDDLGVALLGARTGFETERRLLTREWGIDLGSVEAPVALLHGTGDPVAPPAVGRHLAERIGGARLGKVDGEGHLSTLLSAGETALRQAAPSLSVRR